jgi:uncharacterized repeat protein (TIGR01451 family)
MTTRLLFNRALFGLLAGATLSTAAAAGAPGLAITAGVLREERVAAADGSTAIRLVAPTRVTPGDHLIYQLTYRNRGTAPASGVVIAYPVPEHLRYAGAPAPSASAAMTPDLSVDGKTFGPLSTLTVRDAAGGTRPAQAGDVRVVRWRLAQPVAAGGEGTVAFRALLK